MSIMHLCIIPKLAMKVVESQFQICLSDVQKALAIGI
jgi:hypothetical protein